MATAFSFRKMLLGAESPLREPTIPPAVREPRKPRLKLPPGSCDCHAHVFGPQSRFGYLPNAAYIPSDQTVDDYVRVLRILGCTRAVLVQPSVYGTNHAAMLQAMQSGKFSFRGVAVVSPQVTDRELRALHDAGFRGIRINLASKTPGLPFEAASSLADRIKPLGWHLQFFLNVPTFVDVERRLASLPVNVVIDHFGLIDCAAGLDAPGFATLLRLLRHQNVWMKMSGVYHPSKKPPLAADLVPFARAVVEAAPDRLVWATDWPHPTAAWIPDDGDLVDMLADWVPDESVRHRILVENPARLYQFI